MTTTDEPDWIKELKGKLPPHTIPLLEKRDGASHPLKTLAVHEGF